MATLVCDSKLTARLRSRRTRLVEARARIEVKRAGTSVPDLLAQRDAPENRISVTKEALDEILGSFPGDDD